ncbi:hypothetical protein JCM18899A_31930 [Nocardioides sp. AN3]
MDLAGLRSRLTDGRRAVSRLRAAAERIPIVGRVLSEVVRIEFIDRCLLIAAQGLLALVPMLVVLAAFFPRLTDGALGQLTDVTGIGAAGEHTVEGELGDQVRAQTGFVGIVITVFSATSFARALLRMYERVWELPHIGGISGTRRCFVWLVGWLLMLQLLASVRSLVGGGSIAQTLTRAGVQILALTAIWWLTAWLLLFGRVSWLRLGVGALLAGLLTNLYVRASSV